MSYQLEAAHRKTTKVFALPTPKKAVVAPGPAVERNRSASGFRPGGLTWLGVLVALLVTGAYFRLQSSSESAAPNAQSDAEDRQVNVLKPERAATGAITVPATIQAYQATDLFARASGFLKAWHFDIGATVKAGQVLAEIETPELDQELAQAMALLKQGQAEHQQAIAELEEAKADVALAEANIVKAKANVEFSVSQTQRSQTLVHARAVAREEHENVVRERNVRNAVLESATAELTRRKSNLSTRQAIIKSRAAVVDNRAANVHRLRDLTGFQKIVAPFDGIVTRRHAELGMLVTAGSNTGTRPLFSVAQIEILRVQALVPQSSALGIRPGDLAQVTIPEQPGRTFTAKVARTAGAVEPTSRSLVVEVELPNRDSSLLPGVYAQVRFQSRPAQANWVIPAKTLLMRSNGPHVVIVAADGLAQVQKVTLGRDFGASVEVLVGLNGDERLVVNPSDDLRDGQSVQIVAAGHSQIQFARK